MADEPKSFFTQVTAAWPILLAIGTIGAWAITNGNSVSSLERKLDRIETKLEGLPSLTEKQAQVEARVTKAEGFISLLDGRSNVSERGLVALQTEVTNLKAVRR